MWTMLSNSNIESFFNQYSQLSIFSNELILHKGNEFVFLPRYFTYNFPSPSLTFYTDKTWTPITVDIKMKDGFQLRPKQIGICKTVNNIIESGELCGGIIKARPGAGKTIMAVNIAAVSKRKTLIIVDNTNLLTQWKDAIINFTNVTEDEIGIIQGSKFTVTEKTQFTICLVQTLMSKAKLGMKEFYEKIKNCGFDLVFFDECHQTTCGPKYATASLFINTKNIFGLSATPFADNLHALLMDNALGKIIARDEDYDLIPDINFIKFDSGLTGKYGKMLNYSGDMIKKRAVYVSKLSESKAYTNAGISMTKSLLELGHKVIIIVFTVELVKHFHNELLKIGIESRQFYSQQREIDKVNDKVIIATYKYAGAGFDMPSLSAAILATPLSGRKSLIQVIGRIVREHPDKLNPVVCSLIDTGFNGMFSSEIPKIKSILSAEFKCKFNDIYL